jgi:ubiquinone/menaquinone biosynthesis C-methylase UbiE
MFFDRHPEFLETSDTAASRSRLNMRHLGIIEENRDVLAGSRVVDIASHDGRWSYAALEAGASHVTGIEGRRELVRHARSTFRAKGVEDDRFDFIQGDVHVKLLRAGLRADVVMCLGFLYHTARYVELFKGIRRTRAEHVIIDTRVLQDVEGPMVKFTKEGTRHQAKAIRDRYALGPNVISAVPSEAALIVMLDAAGYDVEHKTDWTALLAQHPRARKIIQYQTGQRVTFRARRRHPRRDRLARGPAQ